MKKDLTEIIYVIDKSGSMEPLRDDTVGGFNSFLAEQQGCAGEAYLTTVLFSGEHHYVHNHVNICEVQPMTREDYVPQGGTALLDAVGDTINEIGVRLANTPEELRPEKIIFMIITDGRENSSTKFTKSQVRRMIEHQTEKYSWEFVFVGANMDAVSEGASYGIGTAATYTANTMGTLSVYTALAEGVKGIRGSCGDSGEVKAILDNIMKDIR